MQQATLMSLEGHRQRVGEIVLSSAPTVVQNGAPSRLMAHRGLQRSRSAADAGSHDVVIWHEMALYI